MKVFNVFLGLGSNLGDRQAHLQRAVDEIKLLQDGSVVWVSSVYETEPWGKKDQPAFLNACMEITTPLLPAKLLTSLKQIEGERSKEERWGPREIDIDILVYDGFVEDGAEVRVPHPEVENRRFVLVPLQEIAPDLVHPVNGMTMTELLQATRDKGRVVKTLHHILL